MLEELGQLEKIKRFAGTSIGAVVAGLLAGGATAQYVHDYFFRTELDDLLFGKYMSWSITLGKLYKDTQTERCVKIHPQGRL